MIQFLYLVDEIERLEKAVIHLQKILIKKNSEELNVMFDNLKNNEEDLKPKAHSDKYVILDMSSHNTDFMQTKINEMYADGYIVKHVHDNSVFHLEKIPGTDKGDRYPR